MLLFWMKRKRREGGEALLGALPFFLPRGLAQKPTEFRSHRVLGSPIAVSFVYPSAGESPVGAGRRDAAPGFSAPAAKRAQLSGGGQCTEWIRRAGLAEEVTTGVLVVSSPVRLSPGMQATAAHPAPASAPAQGAELLHGPDERARPGVRDVLRGRPEAPGGGHPGGLGQVSGGRGGPLPPAPPDGGAPRPSIRCRHPHALDIHEAAPSRPAGAPCPPVANPQALAPSPPLQARWDVRGSVRGAQHRAPPPHPR